MLKHTLVPLDGSEIAEYALEYVSQITDPSDGRITLLTAIDVPEYPATAFYPTVVAYEANQETVTEQLVPQAHDYLNTAADTLRKSGFKVEMEAVIDDPATAIVEAAKRLNVDAIVMCTHGRSGIGRWLFGSVTHKVLGSTHCPVFVVPMKSKSKTE